MRLLILGGTDFVGRHMVDSALAHGHEVTIFNRGQTNPDLFPSVQRRRGDRSDSDLSTLKEGEWDAVIDLTGTLPRVVSEMAELLVGQVGVYVFLSLSSVYRELDAARIDEDAPLKAVAEPTSDAVNASTYGGLKVLSEGEVRRHFPESHLIVRAGTMTGPYDNTDRFTYWVRRMARGLPVLAPSRPDQPIQLLHARDHADFVIQSVASSLTGVFNVVGPDQPTTFADMLDACAEAAGTNSRIVWAPQTFLDARKVRFPLEILAVDRTDGIYRLAHDRARAAGLVNRPLTDTAREVLAWDRDRGQPRLRVVRGVAPPREANLLATVRREHQAGAGRELAFARRQAHPGFTAWPRYRAGRRGGDGRPERGLAPNVVLDRHHPPDWKLALGRSPHRHRTGRSASGVLSTGFRTDVLPQTRTARERHHHRVHPGHLRFGGP